MVPLLVSGAGSSPVPYAEGELLIQFRGGPRGPAAAQVRQAFQHEVRRHFDPIGWQHIQLPPGRTVAEALARYRRHPDVLAVEPNYRLQWMTMGTEVNSTPNDPMRHRQWALDSIGATNAWATTTGNRSVVVAVIDSGVDYLHEDLAANMWRNPGEIPGNGKDDDDNGYVDDVYGVDVVSHDGNPMEGWWGAWTHGTACAGIIGAVGNNALGISGVNWSVQLMAIRFLANTSSNYVYSAGFVEACCYVLDMKSRGVNVRVTSNSYGFTGPPPVVVRTALESLGQAGILNVFAAGKASSGEGTNLDVAPIVFPQYYHLPGTINVAASDVNDHLTFDSNWGATNVDLAAPGVDVVTTQGGAPHTTYYESSGVRGTSVACPYVAGAAALLAAAYPLATSEQIKAALLESVDVRPALVGLVASNGRLNVGRAIHHPLLTSNAPPFVTRDPQSQTNGVGDCVAFCVTASGTQLGYQWQAQGTNLIDSDRITGARDARLTLCDVQYLDAGDYAVVISNAFGQTTSAVAHLTVLSEPRIVEQPQHLTVAAGANATLSVTVTNTASLPVQYLFLRLDPLDYYLVVLDQVTAAYTLTNIQPEQAGTWRVEISNPATALGGPSILSEPAYLTVVVPPSNHTVMPATNVSFTALATGPTPIEYQWQFHGTNLQNGGRIRGVTTPTLTLANVQAADTGTYTVVITNAAGDPTGFAAYLDVRATCPELTVQMVPCAPSPSGWCVHVCWPDTVPTCLPQWTDDLGRPWQPWSGPTTVVPGCQCADIPVAGGTLFFRVDCPP